ncbi:MAG TPA: thiamine pyrophosphate-binding protein [Casimicrobiaceae bacterium]|jgi:thiamine pyrophosphate-dependent acetolactate synthase large subunit-like protein
MNDATRVAPKTQSAAGWGSDAIADLLRVLDIPYIALTPGASFRGLHDSLVNHLGNTRPEMLLCLHEENAVALAHGYARVTGRPLAVALHANVGLMHATMAIFNAWCDRIPMLLLGGVGPIDAVKRRPWVDWIHTMRDLGGLVRGYTKWDDQPGSVAAALESILRAHRIALTLPHGPVYVCLDAALQEEALAARVPLPALERYPEPAAAAPSPEAVREAAALLGSGKRPLMMLGRMSSDPAAFALRVALAERLGAVVLTDIKTGASFPTQHPLHPFPPSLYVGNEAAQAIREADVILSLDWIDLGGTLSQACAGALPLGQVIQCSLDQYVHKGSNMDYQALPPADLSILAPPDALVEALLAAIGPRAAAPKSSWIAQPAARPSVERRSIAADRMPLEDLARVTTDTLAPHRPSYIRLPLGWPGEYCRFAHPRDYIGFDGGGGIGSGPGMAIGAALAMRGGDRLPVAVLGDGDYLMGLTALWTGVHYRVPLLVIVANNESFFNDELHQERMARLRGRPVENRWIGMRMSDPAIDLAALARAQGAQAHGPVRDAEALAAAIAQAVDAVRTGALVVIDARVAPEYSRAVSSSLLKHLPAQN